MISFDYEGDTRHIANHLIKQSPHAHNVRLRLLVKGCKTDKYGDPKEEAYQSLLEENLLRIGIPISTTRQGPGSWADIITETTPKLVIEVKVRLDKSESHRGLGQILSYSSQVPGSIPIVAVGAQEHPTWHGIDLVYEKYGVRLWGAAVFDNHNELKSRLPRCMRRGLSRSKNNHQTTLWG